MCSLIQYAYVCMTIHAFTCNMQFFSTEDETTVNEKNLAAAKTKIRGSDREWERLAGHES